MTHKWVYRYLDCPRWEGVGDEEGQGFDHCHSLDHRAYDKPMVSEMLGTGMEGKKRVC